MAGLPLNVLPTCVEFLAVMTVRALVVRALFPFLNIFTQYLLLGCAILGELILLITFGSLLGGLAS